MEINQVYKAPSLPKIGRRNINSPLNRGALGSGITAKKSTFSFNKVAPKLTSAKLNTDNNKSDNSIKPFKSNLDIVDVLKESNKLLYEIREQLSLDYNERIKEREENLRLAKKRITANKISEKEKKIESRGKSLIGRALNTVIAPAKSIFQRILDFLSIIITGIVLNTAFNWLSKKENQEKLEKFFNFLGDYWKELLVVFGAFKILRLVQKISKIGKGLKSLFNGFKGTGGSARVTTSAAKQGGRIGKGLRSLLDGFKGTGSAPRTTGSTGISRGWSKFNRFFRRNVTGGSNAFTRNLSKLNPFNFNVSKGSNQLGRNLSKFNPINTKVTGNASTEVAKQGGKKVLKEFFKNLPIKAAALSFAIDMATGESMDRALAGLAGASVGATYGAMAFAPIPILGARVVGAILGAIIGEAGMKEIASAMSAVGKLKSDNIAAADNAKREALAAGATDKKMTPGDIEALISGTRIKDAGGVGSMNNIPDMYNDPLGLRRDPTGMGAFSQGGTVPLNRGGIVDNPKPKGYSEGGSIFERIKGTVGGIGSGIQDTVKALLAPGEEVIKTSSANLFRPLLKDINDNAGRLWRQFAESTIIQDKNNKKSEKMNLVFRKLLTEFTELFDKEKREIEKRKRKARRRQPVDPPGGGSPGLSSSRKSPLTSIGKISNSKNTSSPMSTMRSSGKISNSKNTSSPTSPSSLRNTNKVTPQISSTPQSVNKMSNKTPLQAVEIVPFPINNSEKQLESNISTPTPTINIQNIENSPTTMTVSPLVIEKNSGAPSVNVVNLAPKVLDLSKKSTPKPSVTDSDAAPIPSISPFDSNNDFNYTVPETLGILV